MVAFHENCRIGKFFFSYLFSLLTQVSGEFNNEEFLQKKRNESVPMILQFIDLEPFLHAVAETTALRNKFPNSIDVSDKSAADGEGK